MRCHTGLIFCCLHTIQNINNTYKWSGDYEIFNLEMYINTILQLSYSSETEATGFHRDVNTHRWKTFAPSIEADRTKQTV